MKQAITSTSFNFHYQYKDVYEPVGCAYSEKYCHSFQMCLVDVVCKENFWKKGPVREIIEMEIWSVEVG